MTRIILFFLICYLVYAFYKMIHKPEEGPKIKDPGKAGAVPGSSCPAPKTFAGYIEGRIKGKQKQELRKHIDGCKDCMDALQAIFNMPTGGDARRNAKIDYKKVYSTFNPQDTALLKSILEENNIDYYVTNEWSGGVYPHGTGMDIMVVETQAEEARRLIEDFRNKTKKGYTG